MPKTQAAQNQHYVPKFVLRQFLSDPKKEQVNVFRKTTRRGFATSIKNVMAERRFHEFQIKPGYLASFEDAACRVEDIILPVYRTVLDRRTLISNPEERSILALLFAFQMLRTRSYRDGFADITNKIRDKWGSIDGIAKQLPHHEDDFKEMHLNSIQDTIEEFTRTIATKDFMLLEAPSARKFYLADNPVALHNDEPRHPIFGNIGLSVKGIQIYLPLSSDLMLAAWCPSIMEDFESKTRDSHANYQRLASTAVLSPRVMASNKRHEIESQLSEWRQQHAITEEHLRHFKGGTPIPLRQTNMDFYNTMQVGSAREFVICQRGDFDLARRFTEAKNTSDTGNPIV